MSKTKQRGKRWSKDEAERILKEHRESGESVAAFAKRRGLVPERLYRWRRELERHEKRPGRRRRSKTSETRFVEVAGVTHGVAGNGAAGPERLEVVLCGGRRIAVPNEFDAEAMRRLVAVLEGAPC